MIRPERAVIALVLAAAATTFLPARDQDARVAAAAKKPSARVGLVFDVGGRGDKSFNDAAYAGLMRAVDELGIEANFLEPRGSEDREAAMRLFSAQAFDLVIGVGFIFSTDVDNVARAYPNVQYACIDYFPSKDGPPPNVAGLVFREEEGSFLVGAVAGLMTKTSHVGFVGGMETPLIRKFWVGYEAGVKAVCSGCVVHGAYAGATPDAFKDPTKGKAIALSHIERGADVLYHASGATGHGVFEAAKDAHVQAIGVDSDQHDEMPGTVVTSMVKRADVAVFEVVESVVKKRFQGGMVVLGLKEGAIDYVHEGPHADAIPAAVKAEVARLADAIKEGRVVVPRE